MTPKKVIKDGITYNVYPSAIGSSELNVTLPETVIKPLSKYPDTSDYYLWNPYNFTVDRIIDKKILDAINKESSIEDVRKRIYDTVSPRGYDPFKAYLLYNDNKQRKYTGYGLFDSYEDSRLREALWAKYLQQEYYKTYDGNYQWNIDAILPSAVYQPTKGKFVGDLVRIDPNLSKKNELSDARIGQMLLHKKETGNNTMLILDDLSLLGRYTQSFGEDEKGPYISYYDEWDLNPFAQGASSYGGNTVDILPITKKLRQKGDLVLEYGISKPFSLYDRRYFDIKDSDKYYNAYKDAWKLLPRNGRFSLSEKLNFVSPF